VMARLAGSGAFGFGGELLQTRCPGPLLADVGGRTHLAVGRIPRRALTQTTLRLHLDQGVSVTTSSYRLQSRPNLTVVLEREGVERGETELGVVARR
jgi:hypothetical protein